jgi:ribosomal protein L32
MPPQPRMLVAAALREARSALSLGRALASAALAAAGPQRFPSLSLSLTPAPPQQQHQQPPFPRFGGLELAGFGAGAAPDAGCAADRDGDGDGDGDGGLAGAASPSPSPSPSPLSWSTWLMAVPKRRHSHSRKRHRQSNPLYQEAALAHTYPCPKCDRGLVKMRHHLCPCDQDKVGAAGVVRVSYGSSQTPPTAT